MDLEEARQALLKEMKETKGSRFNGAKRLEGRDRRMVRVTLLDGRRALFGLNELRPAYPRCRSPRP